MKCPKCEIELDKGEVQKEKDGTEYFELKCPKCKNRFMDLKIPYSALAGFEEEREAG